MADPAQVDVLIIGAGPAGVMCATALARGGVRVRIVDKRPEKVMAGQADGIQPRTIEMLQSYGLAEELLRHGNQMHMAAFYNPSASGGIERTGRASDVTAPTARFPFEVTLHQGEIEKIFLDAMAERGVEVQRACYPESLEVSSDPAVLSDLKHMQSRQVVLRHAERPEDQQLETVQAKFVLGSDGAHSWVRKTLEIPMEGESTDYVWGVVDSIPKTDFPDIRNKSAIHSNNGSCMVIPREGDIVRLYIQLDQSEFVRGGRVDKSQFSVERLFEVARKSFHPFTIDFPPPVLWWTLYIIGQRVAARYSQHERVFIAGDACHTHSPKAGQGMNASMNDSHNLAWKLVHVLRGWSDMSLLKTYEFERRKYAQDLIDFDRQFSKLFSGKPRTEDFQDGVTHEQFLATFQTFGLFSSGIGVHYAPSDIVDKTHQELASNLIIGQRLIPQVVLRAADARPENIQELARSDLRFKLLVFAGDIAQPTAKSALQKLAEQVDDTGTFVRRLTPKDGPSDAVFDILTIATTKKEVVNYTDVPATLRSHWSKVWIDDEQLAGGQGGKVYETYGITPGTGAIVVVRPDGYVSAIAPLDGLRHLDAYFSRFMRSLQ
ncbi:FAD binding domain-containing protein [Auriculariales sp. MPI-PUGE-AT-0066]|nr:FAD binding domain-containing protein [Auriculariales sp. MPI-PUGE-AT-0066]